MWVGCEVDIGVGLALTRLGVCVCVRVCNSVCGSKPAGAPSTFREQSLRFKLRGSSAKIEDDEAFFSAAKKKMLRQKREKEMAKINAEKTKNYKSKSRPSKHDHHHRKIVVDDSKEQNIARAATRQLQDKSFRGIESGKIGFWDKAR